MLAESVKRAAALAVSQFGVSRDRIREMVRATQRAEDSGQQTDLVALLVEQKLLSPGQAAELRRVLRAAGDQHPVATKQAPAAPPVAADTVSPEDSEESNEPGVSSAPELREVGGYRLLRRLGEGGMGAVYLAYDEREGRAVAIKILSDQLANNPTYVERFRREARSALQLDHPNIIRGLAVDQDVATGKHFIVMEYVDGLSAQSLLERYGKLPVGDAIHIALDIARALEHAHSRSIIHRDIKPDNILLTRTGLAKLADLGLARRTDEASNLTGLRQTFGTPYYMPYEQALNARKADTRSDIYALGATLYHLVTGEVPFPGDSALEVAEKKDVGEYRRPSALNPSISPILDQILANMIARDARDRYQTASELIVAFERSNLTAPVPSFIDLDVALQDPLIRARLTSPAQPTQPDLQAVNQSESVRGSQLWHLRYRSRDGRSRQFQATTQQILERIGAGRLSAALEASDRPQGDYRLLKAYPEFRKALATRKQTGKGGAKRSPQHGALPPATVEPSITPRSTSRPAWLIAVALGLLAVLASAAFWLLG